MASNRKTPYNKVSFTEEGKIKTDTKREGSAKAYAYYARGRTLIEKAKELHKNNRSPC